MTDFFKGFELFKNVLQALVAGAAFYGFANQDNSFTIQSFSAIGLEPVKVSWLFIAVLSILFLILINWRKIKK